jgi:hypothetical protein
MTTLRDDLLVPLLKAAGVEVTRENWIDLNWGREIPDPWTAEDEGEVPEELQDWSKVKTTDE